jgi:DNA-binding Lrp family transcriptional regulator
LADGPYRPDALDVELLAALRRSRRAGVLELSRLLGVARATVQDTGVVTGYGPDVDLAAAGYPVRAYVTLEIAQGGLDQVASDLEVIPGILEAHATTGTGDVLCVVAAASHEHLQQTLLELNRCPAVVRTTSVIALSQVVPTRYLPLLRGGQRPGPTRAVPPTTNPPTPGSRKRSHA